MLMVWEQPDVYKTGKLNQDDLWKKVIADLFEDFLLFFLPEFHGEVDFSKPVEFLQQELFKEIIEERKGRKVADQIAKVHLKSGEEQWVLVHTEVQVEDDIDFAKRMFEYFYRIYDRYGKKVVAIAVFTNTSTKSTNQYHYQYFGTNISYTFNKFVLSDFDEESLNVSPKLFSKAVLASIYMNKTKNEMTLRSAYKRALLREVWTLENASKMEISALLYFVDYIMKLPPEMSEKLTRDLKVELREEEEEVLKLHKDDLPPTLAGVLELERQEGFEQGIKHGVEQGIHQGIEQGIHQGIHQMIENMMEQGVQDEFIAQITKFPMEKIAILRKEFEAK